MNNSNYDITIIGTEIDHKGWTTFIIKGEERRITHFVNNHLKTDLLTPVMSPFWSYEDTYEITLVPKDDELED
jgi:hypothetical protein